MNRQLFAPITTPKTSPVDDDPKGTYRVWDRGTHVRVNLSCPGCGNTQGLSHSIDAEGNINPSLVCDVPPCNFHEYGKLDAWTYGPIDDTGRKLSSLQPSTIMINFNVQASTKAKAEKAAKKELAARIKLNPPFARMQQALEAAIDANLATLLDHKDFDVHVAVHCNLDGHINNQASDAVGTVSTGVTAMLLPKAA
jgi:hypothetical protein